MPLWAWILIGIAPSLPFLLWAAPVLGFLHGRRLDTIASDEDDAPSISIVITAKDEAESITACLDGALGHRDPGLEVIVVNDRSTDDTGSIIDSFAARDARVIPVHIDTLPDGWIGKCNAMARGAEQATGEYILFMDGDVILSDSALKRSGSHMRANRLDHLTLVPATIANSIAERAFLALFLYLGLGSLRAWAVRKRKGAFAGFGAFNMVKRSSYEARGGHEALRFEVVDDILLGRLMKTNGGQSDVLVALDDVRVRWQPDARALVTGMEKNGFAAAHYSVPLGIFLGVMPTICLIGPWIATAILRDERALGFATGSVLFHLCYGLVGRGCGNGFSVAPFLIISIPLLSLAMLRSTWVTVRQNGVRWRDTFYALEELRTRHRVLWKSLR